MTERVGFELTYPSLSKLAEGTGFEPVRGFLGLNGLANRRLRPLGQPSILSLVPHPNKFGAGSS